MASLLVASLPGGEVTVNNHVREQDGIEPCEIAKNFRVLMKWSNKFDCLIFEMFFIRDLKPKQTERVHPRKAVCSTLVVFLFHFLFILHFHIPLSLLFVGKYLSFYFSLSQKFVYMRNFLSMNVNLKMTVERSKRRPRFSSLVLITKQQ